MVKVQWLGHACFLIENKDARIIIDPFIIENPKSPIKDLDSLGKIDYILVTHGHYDHLGDTVEIAKKYDSEVIAIYELAEILDKYGIRVVGMNFGGTLKLKHNIKVSLVPAVHSSSIIYDEDILYAGNPAGFIINIDGKNIYHSGDTMVFYDMKLFPELFGKIDLALLPIGGHYTMDIKQMIAAAELLKPDLIIPMHYNTFEAIKANLDELKEYNINIKILKPGESVEL